MGSSPNKVFAADGLTVFSDGSILRSPCDPPDVPAHGDGAPVASKDLPLNRTLATWLRLFLPRSTSSSSSSKLPVLLYFHGGGFCYSSTARPHYHRFLCSLAAHARALIVSVEYRLAPEHRLPAAYHDGFDALLWLHTHAAIQASAARDAAAEPEPWLSDHADFSNCFVAGDSAGANIAHHVGLRATQQSWEHLLLKGMILIHPFFSSVLPTDSEVRRSWWGFIEHLWALSLPIGASRDHPFSNPSGASLADAALPPAMVAVASEDGLKDRGVAYYEALKKAGKKAALLITENEEHVFFLHTEDTEKVRPFLHELANFLNSGKL